MRVRAKLELRARNNGAYLGHSAYGIATCDVPLPQKGPDRQRIGVLSEFDRYSFRVGACRTFKGPLIMIDLFGWCDTRKKHWQPALRASPLSNRRLRRIEIIWMRHSGSLSTAPVATKHIVHV